MANKLSKYFLILLIAFIAFVGVVMVITLLAIGEWLIAFLMFSLILFLLFILWKIYNRISYEGFSIRAAFLTPLNEVDSKTKELELEIVNASKKQEDKSHILQMLDDKTSRQRQSILKGAFKLLVENLLQDGGLSEENASQIVSYFEGLGANINEIKKQEEYVQLSKLVVINCLLSGKMPTGVVANTGGQFVKFAEGEHAIADQGNAIYNEVREVTTHYGFSSGNSIQIGKGRYSRMGAFMSSSKTSLQVKKTAKGTLLLTNENIYFFSTLKTVKIPYDKILSYKSYSDGIGINLKDSRRRPIIITGIDGWFVFNIVTNIDNLT